MNKILSCIVLMIALHFSPALQAQTGLKGQYYSDNSFNNLVKTQVDPTLNFNWGHEGPKNLDVRRFTTSNDISIRWTGFIRAVESGTYTFSIEAEDTVRLWIGDLSGTPVINQPNWPGGNNSTSGTFVMTAGQLYPIKIDYTKNPGGSKIYLRWTRPGGSSVIVPQSQLKSAQAYGTGLTGAYFSDTTFNTLVKTQIDPSVDFDWGTGSPTSGVEADNYSVRWSGQIEAVEAGTYSIAVVADERAKVWIQDLSGNPLIDQTSSNGGNPTSATFTMKAGYRYDVKVEYIETTGASNMRLLWTRPGASSVAIPQMQLHPQATIFPATASGMVLPIEVMGAEGTQVSLTLPLTAGQASSANRMWLQTHNLRYNDKGSVQINGGGWVPLNNATATMLHTSEIYGGIGGSFAVLKMTLPVAPGQLVAGNNIINFRFNMSNGLAVGYRIIKLNLLDAAGTNLLPPAAFTQTDPSTWQPPSSAAADISAGENLWRNGNLISSYKPGAVSLNAKCASCHLQDGRDLKYFSYSNHTIIERSKFHGLSQTQGEQIASYIRTRPVGNPGRPWNPPYQPGPGTSTRPNSEWLAGAGIDNVLDDDADTLQDIFPNGVRRDALMEGDTNKFKRYSSHDTRLAFQLPDWNHWLPEIHPVDAFPAYFDTSKSKRVYNALRSQLVGKTPTQIEDWMRNSSNNTNNGNVRSGYFLLTDFYGDVAHDFADTAYPNLMSTNNNHSDPAVARMIYSFVLWKMVKHVEIHEEFGLTSLGKVPNNIGWAGYESRDALPRMWLGANRSVFDSSPFLIHLEYPLTGSTSGDTGFNHEYLSNSWYQLQLILNGGQRTGSGHAVLDFGYTWQFTSAFEKSTNYRQMGRNFVWCLKGMDEGDNDIGPNQSEGWSFNRATLSQVAAYYGPTPEQTPPLISPFNKAALAMLVQVWLEKNASWLPEQIFAYADGTPKNGNEDGVQFDLRTWVVGSGDNQYQARSIGQGKFSELASAKALNSLPPALMNGYAQWCQVVWPGLDGNGNARNNWLQFTYPRVGTAPAAPALNLAATYGDVRVSWTPVAGITSYNVKRATVAAGPYLTVAYFRNSGEYTDSVPLQNQEYYYKLSANTAAGESADSPATLTELLRNRLMGSYIGTTPSRDSKTREATDGDRHSISSSFDQGSWTGLDLGSAKAITRIGYVPQRAYSQRMIGGKFQGSNSANFSSGVVDLLTINSASGDGYKQQNISNPSTFRYVRYLIPAGGGDSGEFAEMTFWDNAATVAEPSINSTLTRSGTVGIAISNYTIIASNSPTSYGATGLPAGLNINTSTGVISGTPTSAGTSNVTLSATNAGGTGTATLVFTINPAPTALETFRTDHGLAANGSGDSATPAGDGTANLLKFAFNMIGGATGQGTALTTPNAATLLANGSAGLPRVSTDGTGKLQLTYIRRKAATNSGITYTVEFSSTLAAGSWAVNDLATTIVTSIDSTFERVTVTDSSAVGKRFARVKVNAGTGLAVKLSGTVIGTLGSWANIGNTREKAFDGDTNSFFDAATANGNWVGLDLGTAQVISQVRYFPRAVNPERMNGGLFQGSNTADFSTGVTTLHTLSGTAPVAFSSVAINNPTSFRYVRYLSPDNAYGNVAELEFYKAGNP